MHSAPLSFLIFKNSKNSKLLNCCKLDPCVYEVFDSESALELNPEVLTLTPGTPCVCVRRKRPEGEADHLRRCSFDVKNVWLNISTSLCAFMVWRLIEVGGLMYTATVDPFTSWHGYWRWLIMKVCVVEFENWLMVTWTSVQKVPFPAFVPRTI
jgi:hypothetical protein